MKALQRRFRNTFRWIAGIGLLSVTLLSQQACLPGPTSMQVDTITNCGGDPRSNGSLDVAVTDTYLFRVALINNLATLNDPSTFRPETNVIDLRTATVWFEYPAGFSRLGLGAELLRTQQNPLTIPMAGQLKPTLLGDFIGQGGLGGGAGVAAPSGENVSFYLVPTEVSRIWAQAGELEATAITNQEAFRQSGPSFTVRAHITITGVTRGGQIIATQDIVFPIRVCKGCLDNRKESTTKENALCTGAGGGAGGAFACPGQDGNCAEANDEN